MINLDDLVIKNSCFMFRIYDCITCKYPVHAHTDMYKDLRVYLIQGFTDCIVLPMIIQHTVQ